MHAHRKFTEVRDHGHVVVVLAVRQLVDADHAEPEQQVTGSLSTQFALDAAHDRAPGDSHELRHRRLVATLALELVGAAGGGFRSQPKDTAVRYSSVGDRRQVRQLVAISCDASPRAPLLANTGGQPIRVCQVSRSTSRADCLESFDRDD